jgi:predicted DNA-binding protein (UPF0251 family)
MSKRRERRARVAGKRPPAKRKFPFRKGTEKLPPFAVGVMENIEARRLKALDLRRSGLTYRKIAVELGVSTDTAWEDVQAELGHIMAQKAVLADQVFEMEVARLDDVMRGSYELGTSGKDADAARVVLKCIDMRCRLFGLYAETPTGGGGPNAGGGYVPAGSQGGIINVTPEAVWTSRIEDTRKRLAAAETAAIDWSAFEHAGEAAKTNGDLAPPVTVPPKVPTNGGG